MNKRQDIRPMQFHCELLVYFASCLLYIIRFSYYLLLCEHYSQKMNTFIFKICSVN